MADSSKRKLIEEPSPTKTKKSKVSQDQASLPRSIKVTSVLRPQSAPPIVATTPGINIPESVEFHAYVKHEQSKKQKKDAPPAVKELMLHSTNHERMEFTAREDRPEIMNKLVKHYIGAFDPKTGELEVIEARKMIVRGAVRARKAADEAMAMPLARKMFSEMKTDLGESFGTKKARKALKSIVENAVTSTSDQKGKLSGGDAALLKVVKENTANMLTAEELQAMTDQMRSIPPGNFDADVIQDVYKPDVIIGRDVLEAIPIKDWQESIKNRVDIQVQSRFVANRVRRVGSNDDAVSRLRILRYFLFLMIFFKSAKNAKGKREGKKPLMGPKLSEALDPAPEIVIESIRRKFTDKGEIDKRRMDLIKTHLCVLSCLVDNFETNTLDLREDLEMDQKDLMRYFSEIGASNKVSKAGGVSAHIAKLALPLQFPKPPVGKKGKR